MVLKFRWCRFTRKKMFGFFSVSGVMFHGIQELCSPQLAINLCFARYINIHLHTIKYIYAPIYKSAAIRLCRVHNCLLCTCEQFFQIRYYIVSGLVYFHNYSPLCISLHLLRGVLQRILIFLACCVVPVLIQYLGCNNKTRAQITISELKSLNKQQEFSFAL